MLRDDRKRLEVETAGTLGDRFWSKVDLDGPEGRHFATGESLGPCWVWRASKDGAGYGQFSAGGRGVSMWKPHRLIWIAGRGPIPYGRELDHLCRNRACCNAGHLEPVTRSVNVRRGVAPDVHRARYALITGCPQGHPYTPENTYMIKRTGRPNTRHCRACVRDRAAAATARRRAA